jgi:LacI family transcriptional regulator
VVGFDDLDFAILLDPPLTTVAADAAELGALAFETLAKHMAGERVPRVRTLPVTLTIRGSTGPPRKTRKGAAR